MEKINIAELLKDCPKGMELYSPIFGIVYLNGIKKTRYATLTLIEVSTSSNSVYEFYPDGKFNTHYTDSECLLFPSKEQRDWSKFQKPFKDGDIVFYNDTIAIFKEWGDETLFRTHVTKYLCNDSVIDTNVPLFGKSVRKEIRFATEKEKQKLFDTIKDNGYKWNAETKTLEKLPRFKVGDRIKHKKSGVYCNIGEYVESFKGYNTNIGLVIRYDTIDDWELYPLPNKFDIATLVPFESRVLVRDKNTDKWKSNFWGFYDIDNAMNYPYECCGNSYAQCIPYEGNEYLLGKTDDCKEFYKIWE